MKLTSIFHFIPFCQISSSNLPFQNMFFQLKSWSWTRPVWAVEGRGEFHFIPSDTWFFCVNPPPPPPTHYKWRVNWACNHWFGADNPGAQRVAVTRSYLINITLRKKKKSHCIHKLKDHNLTDQSGTKHFQWKWTWWETVLAGTGPIARQWGGWTWGGFSYLADCKLLTACLQTIRGSVAANPEMVVQFKRLELFLFQLVPKVCGFRIIFSTCFNVLIINTSLLLPSGHYTQIINANQMNSCSTKTSCPKEW